jgi:hypothetical protein
MYTKNKKRFYSPQFSGLAAVSVRRLAWALGKSMPATVDLMVRLMPSIIDPVKVCFTCKDSTKCKGCIFGNQADEQDKAALLAF